MYTKNTVSSMPLLNKRISNSNNNNKRILKADHALDLDLDLLLTSNSLFHQTLQKSHQIHTPKLLTKDQVALTTQITLPVIEIIDNKHPQSTTTLTLQRTF